ncbi:DUF3039 domain-containing protein [Saxibacter everestensis]|uniref:DUF3039 domain-containing protein n=1 Tax=Saxibacter everestensis TaxID=2909229 RepID=A0ABY8QPC6_9MICO|nr:DUF3039 domain-containing protein [Brevibacteriaceae bacterium ZFBP1038]
MSETTPGAPAGPMSSPSTGGAAVIEREEQRQLVEPGDHERFSHYAPKDKIMESMVTGQPLIALCGKVWVPSRDPQKFPVCPQCKAIYEGMDAGKGDDDQSGN